MTKKFDGVLAEPLPPIFIQPMRVFLGLDGSSPEEKEARERLLKQKIALIKQHYGIDESTHEKSMEQLAYRLLKDFVPGFQVANPHAVKGRPLVWSPFRISFLVREMNVCMAEKKRSASDAANLLAKREPWKALCAMTKAEENPAEVLRKKFTDARDLTDPAHMSAAIIRASEDEGRSPAGTYAMTLSQLANARIPPPYW